MVLLKVGDKIPDFSCFDDKENLITNKDLIGKKTIIFFYPRANTPGCTAQACNLSENFSELSKVGFSIIGVSADKVKSQSSFSSKFGGFPYPLLADTEKKLINAFGVWGMKKFMGREYMGVTRSSFLVNEKGKIFKTYPKVKPKGHALLVLEDFKE